MTESENPSVPRLATAADTDQTVLVAGATGTVGREVVRGLLERGVRVRALTRHPERATVDSRAEIVGGDVADVGSLERAVEGVDAVHLISFDAASGPGGGSGALQNADALIELLRRHRVRRVTVLQNGRPGPLEEAVLALGPDDGLTGTVLMPVEFMANALGWAEGVRDHGRVEEAYLDRLSAMVHEGDIGDVAAVALTEDGYGGGLSITGPELLSIPDKVDTLAAALGRPVELVELSADQFADRLRAAGVEEKTIGFLQEMFANTPEVGRTIADTVPAVTGHPGRTFRQWATEHAAAFRP